MGESKPDHTLNFAAAEAVPESHAEMFTVPVHVDSWDEYFLYMAKMASIKSKDPKCPVGAVIVSKDHILLSTGFNGLARGVYDDDKTLEDADEKLKVICHAEDNSILNAARIGARLEGATIYVTKFPCLACCNAIIQAGIKRIYTHDNEFWGDDRVDKDHVLKKKVLHEARIEVIAPYHPAFLPAAPIRGEKRKRKPGPEKAPPVAPSISKTS